jgi:hypothetical protein
MNGDREAISPPKVAPERREVSRTTMFSAARVVRLAKLIALAITVTITLLFVAGPAGSRVISLLGFDKQIDDNIEQMVIQGRQTFRFDTFGDDAFWGDMLKLHRAIEGLSLAA